MTYFLASLKHLCVASSSSQVFRCQEPRKQHRIRTVYMGETELRTILSRAHIPNEFCCNKLAAYQLLVWYAGYGPRIRYKAFYIRHTGTAEVCPYIPYIRQCPTQYPFDSTVQDCYGAMRSNTPYIWSYYTTVHTMYGHYGPFCRQVIFFSVHFVVSITCFFMCCTQSPPLSLRVTACIKIIYDQYLDIFHMEK